MTFLSDIYNPYKIKNFGSFFQKCSIFLKNGMNTKINNQAYEHLQYPR